MNAGLAGPIRSQYLGCCIGETKAHRRLGPRAGSTPKVYERPAILARQPKHVGGLDVPVHVSACMQILQPLRHVGQHLYGCQALYWVSTGWLHAHWPVLLTITGSMLLAGHSQRQHPEFEGLVLKDCTWRFATRQARRFRRGLQAVMPKSYRFCFALNTNNKATCHMSARGVQLITDIGCTVASVHDSYDWCYMPGLISIYAVHTLARFRLRRLFVTHTMAAQ